MTKSIRSRPGSLVVMLAALALFATACGGGGRDSALANEATSAAAVNEATLVLTDDLATTQFLHTSDGTITSLSEVVTGDRAVLLWYWAPH